MTPRLAAASTEIIRSRQNARLKDLRQRFLHSTRGNDGLIAIEGEHLVTEAARSGLRVETLFVREDYPAQKVLGLIETPHTCTVVADAFNYVCATDSPQGIAALVQAPRWDLDSLLEARNPLLIVLAALQDPGNLGTILRTAEAFGGSGVLLTPGSANPWNQKVLRASAGSSFRVPVVSLESEAALEQVRENGIPLYATAAQGGTSLLETNLFPPVALVIGNEGAGIPKRVLALCSGTISIPLSGPVESLNAAVAASILLYETSRRHHLSANKINP